MVKRLSLDRNVVFTGWVTDKEVVQLLRSSKLFLFPSKYEGFALAVGEAMACGLCCIISDISALRENFSSAADFADPDDPDAFTNRVLHYLENENERIKLSYAAHRFVQNLGWESVVRTEAHVIRSTVNRLKPISQ
jgi:glycosyltransferase involved in cell wall biosynthesis